MVTMSLASRSSHVMAPVALRGAAPSSSLAAPVCVMAEISGWSFVPVRVMVTTLGGAEVSEPSIAPESSLATTLKERVRVSSLRRKSRF